MPQELLGVWRTSSHPYEDRYLELTSLKVRFGDDADSASTHQVAEVREFTEAGETEYRIRYVSPEGYEYLLSVQYSSADRILRLTNQPQMAWTRAVIYEG